LNVNMLHPNETTYVFISGKNWKLSLAELISFLKAKKTNFKVADFSKSFFTVAAGNILDASLVNYLGGIIKVGRVLSQIPTETVEDAFIRREDRALTEIRTHLFSNCVFDELFKTEKTKCVFGVSIYFENTRLLRVSKKIQRFVGSCFKDELASRGIKARFMGFPEDRYLPQLTHVEVLKKGLVVTGAEVLFCSGREYTFISKTVAVHNPFEFQKRDLGRPAQRKIFSIPPRLAKIMVNLAMCLPGKVLLDPFCGVGTILQEALVINAHVIGMDINPWCVQASCKNLDWLKLEYDLKEAKYTIMLGDARSLTDKIVEETVDCIVTEPDLGPALRHFPTEAYARRIADKLKPMYCDFLGGAYRALRVGGRLVLVAPLIKTRSETFVNLNLEEKAKVMGFRIIHPFQKEIFVNDTQVEELTKMSSFIDMEKRHKIGREINILQK
jgi:tRNA G10  N-methylase Trm11